MQKQLLLFMFLAVSSLMLSGFISSNPPARSKVKYSKKMNAVMQAKCYGCHSPQGKGEKARNKLNWDELPNLTPAQQLEKIKMIQGVLDEGSMPPKFLVEKDPGKKLTEAETATLKKWAKKTNRKLSK